MTTDDEDPAVRDAPWWQPPAPRRLHALRNDLAAWLASPTMHRYTTELIACRRGTIIPPAGSPAESAAILLREEHDRLSAARLYFVTGEMTDVARRAEITMPEEAITPDSAPCATGLMVFASPIAVYQSPTDGTVPIVACSWGCSPACEPAAGGLWLTFWSASNRSLTAQALQQVMGLSAAAAHQEALRLQPELCWDQEVLVCWEEQTVGRVDASGGRSEVAVCVIDQPHTRQWTRVVLASWLLITQRSLVDTTEQPAARPLRRSTQRAGHSADPVRVISIHRTSHRRATSGEGQSTTGRATVRFPVAGHWRNQAYGPQWTLRRWVFIPSHWRGPEDAPTRLPMTVHLVDAPPRPPRTGRNRAHPENGQ